MATELIDPSPPLALSLKGRGGEGEEAIFADISTLYESAIERAEEIVTDYQEKKARRVLTRALGYLAPPPDLSTAEWADEYRYIADGTSQHPGKWLTSRRPFLRGIMDAFDDPRIETVTIKKASRMGITECINNKIGRHIHYDPCAMMYVQQTLGEAKKYNGKIFAPFVRVTRVLHDILPPEKSRKGGTTILEKSFPGGSLTLVGANVPTGFRMVYVKVIIFDDVDGFEWVVGKEGDPVENGIGRTAGIWDRKIILTSKPTIKGYSRIDGSYEQSDKQLYHVPCPHCDHGQVLRWGGKDLDFGVKWDAGDPYSAYYLCEHCHGVIRDFHKERMNAEGKWIATAVPRDPRHRGFGELSQLYHPDIVFHELARDFLKVKSAPEQLQVWVNDRMGECWEDKGDGMDEDGLLGRRENYGVPVMLDGVQYNTTPADVAVLTASADVGENHLAVTVCGWGKDEECWVLEYTMFEGDTLQPDIWETMLAYLKRPWLHPSGLKLLPKCVPVDSGFRDEMVSAFVRGQARGNLNIIAIKGDEKTRAGKIMSDLPAKKNKHKVHIYIVNATRTKTSVFGRLKIKTGSPASLHFPVTVDAEYFKGLLSERWVSVMQQGQRVRRLLKKPGVRNEPLDTMGYNIAALEWLKNHRRFDLNNEAAQMRARVDAEEQRRMAAGELTPTEYYQERVKKLQEKQVEENPEQPPRRTGSWATGWKRLKSGS